MAPRLRRAAAASQYALLLGLIGVFALLAVAGAGRSLSQLLARVGNGISGVSGNTTANSGGGAGGSISLGTGSLSLSPITGGVSPGACTVIPVTNGATDVSGLSLTFSGGNAGNFQTCTPTGTVCGATLAANGNCNFGARLSASLNGAYSTSAVVTTSGGPSASRTITATADGFGGGISAGSGTLALAPITGGVSPGGCTAIPINNLSGVTVTGLTLVIVHGETPNAFQPCTHASNPCGSTLAPATLCNFGMRLVSGVNGAYLGQASFTTDNVGGTYRNMSGAASGFSCPGGTLTAADAGCDPGDGTQFAGYTLDTHQPLYVTPTDIGSNPSWKTVNSQSFPSLCSSGSCLYDGAANTAFLVNTANFAAGTHPAAEACDQLVFGGKSDWYLPAIAELDVIYTNLITDDAVNGGNDPDNPLATQGIFGSGATPPTSLNGPGVSTFNTTASSAAARYWSSSERTTQTAWTLVCNTGEQNSDGMMGSSRHTRCVRR